MRQTTLIHINEDEIKSKSLQIDGEKYGSIKLGNDITIFVNNEKQKDGLIKALLELDLK